MRVVRAAVHDSPHAPQEGYRYDGLYRVDRHWTKTGQDGYLVIQYRLEQIPDTVADASTPEGPPATAGLEDPSNDPTLEDTNRQGPVQRRTTVVQRQVRRSQIAQAVKRAHNYACQVCGTQIAVGGGLYAEGAHIRPLGEPHHGPDVASNLPCLCPNDHVRFDNGGIIVLADLTILDCLSGQPLGTLRTATAHQVDHGHLAYHRQLAPPPPDL